MTEVAAPSKVAVESEDSEFEFEFERTVRLALRELIVNNLVPLDDDELTDDMSLVDDVLDSLGISEVAVFIEDQIGRPLAENEETRRTFASVSSVVEFIVRNC